MQFIEEDEELQNFENVQKLIEQVRSENEDYTLTLSDHVKQILAFFRVTIVGTQEKRQAKRIRLLTHFMRQFFKFIKMEKEWANDIKNNDMGISEKKKYEDSLKRKERDLLNDVKLMGEKGLEALHKRHQLKVLTKLMDEEDELAEQELLEAKGEALRELLQDKGPNKRTLDFQKE